MTTLITIPFSHFCEKARWALDHGGVQYQEDKHLPIFHYIAARRAGARRTVPILVDGKTLLTDSSDIAAWVDTRHPGSLLPTDAATRATALALEDDFDRELGPAARRWTYFQMLPRRDLDAMILRDIPRWEATALRVVRPVAVALMRRGMNITPAGVARSRVKIEETFARVGALLGDGRRYLTGDRFTIADLTFAALASPILAPPNHPYPAPPVEDFATEAGAQIEAWRATTAGRHAIRMYETERVTPRAA